MQHFNATRSATDTRLTGGSARISELVADGVTYDLATLATDLTEGEVYELEREEIAELDKPLNVQGPVKSQRD